MWLFECPDIICWKGPLNGLGILVKNELNIDILFHLWTLNFIAMIYMSSLMPVPHYLNPVAFQSVLKSKNPPSCPSEVCIMLLHFL